MTLVHRYQLLRKLATGGMADVFLALQWGDGGFVREAVVKRLHAHLHHDPRCVRMFLDEGRLLASLRHPGFPHVYDLRRGDEGWYMAMEHVRGPSLADMRAAEQQRGVLTPLPVALAIVAEACSALHCAHEHRDVSGKRVGVVHGDLTPDNVLLGHDGRVKVLDFGVAVTSATDTRADGLRGTLRYMSPEQVTNDSPVDRRSDVYALGILLFELTTGRRLHEGTDVQVLTRVAEEEVPAPTDVRPGYPSDLEPIVLRALARLPDARPRSAAELAEEIQAYADRHRIHLGAESVRRHITALCPDAVAPTSLDIGSQPSFVVHPEIVPEEDDTASEPARVLDDWEHREALGDLSLLEPDSVEDTDVLDREALAQEVARSAADTLPPSPPDAVPSSSRPPADTLPPAPGSNAPQGASSHPPRDTLPPAPSSRPPHPPPSRPPSRPPTIRPPGFSIHSKRLGSEQVFRPPEDDGGKR